MCLISNTDQEQDMTGTVVWKAYQIEYDEDGIRKSLFTPVFGERVYSVLVKATGPKSVRRARDLPSWIVNGGYIHACLSLDHAIKFIEGFLFYERIVVKGALQGSGYINEGYGDACAEAFLMDEITYIRIGE